MAVLSAAAVLGCCASPTPREISFDQAVAIADAAAKRALSPNRPLRVLIATEKDVRSVKRCLDDDYDLAYVQLVREKVAGRRLYVIRYPLPPIIREDGDCRYDRHGAVCPDRPDTGEVLGVFSD